MKNCILLFALIATLSLGACKGDNASAETEEMTEEVIEEKVESMAEEILVEELEIEDEVEENVSEEGAVANEVEVELEEVVVDKEKQREEKRAILKEQLKESPNLGKDCESILKDYTALVEKYISGVDQDAVVKQLAEWANDPLYNKCKKDPAYSDQFYDLEEKMYADEEEEF